MLDKNFILMGTLAVVMAVCCLYANMAEGEYVKNGLVGYWTFDDKDVQGGTAKDIVGGNDGELMGDAEIVEGRIGEAVKLDGNGDFVDLGVDINAKLTGPLTVEAWFNFVELRPADVHILMGSREGAWETSTGISYLYVNNYNTQGFKTAFRLHHDGTPCIVDYNPFEPELGTWYHLVGTFDGSKLVYYEDGEQVAASACNNPSKESGRSLKIGWDDNFGAWFFNGLADEVRIYDRALSAVEVKQNFLGIVAVDPAGRLALSWGEMKVR